ncbi:hypothetical protein [Actinomyces procaprae]|uniref:hypothetical protein n=1 Tax=Actinomyces procaprae TaxID=2560010 RepID=UPI001B351A2C|nr:hypothetical protein [Actinomyces procaprae]
MLTEFDSDYLRRIAAGCLPGLHRDRVYGIAYEIDKAVGRTEDAPAVPDDAPPASAVGRYVKRPVIIEALRYDGTVAGSITVLDWIGDAAPDGRADNKGGILTIHTLEGDMVASPGDWIIRGVQGEFYPCKPDIFEATYQLAPDPTQEA